MLVDFPVDGGTGILPALEPITLRHVAPHKAGRLGGIGPEIRAFA
jgi:hypothetical protein